MKRGGAGMGIRGVILLGASITVGWALTAAAAGEPMARRSLLATLRDGQWDLRQRGSSAGDRICVKGGMALIQLRHQGRACDRLTLEDSPSSILIQYTCKGSGFGRTRIRRETAQLVQIETQGVAEGFPFDYAVEGRWVGDCPRAPG